MSHHKKNLLRVRDSFIVFKQLFDDLIIDMKY